MALVLISGQPSSGKSTVAALLKQLLEAKDLQAVIVDEPGLSMTRNESYENSVNEKNTRGRLRSAVAGALSRNKYIILDSLNNIKGYRYELWCIARSASVRYCVVHCSVPKETAWAWNQARAEATLPAAASKTEGTPSGAAVGEKGTPSAPARQEQVTPHTAAAAQEEGTPLAEAAAREEGTPSAAKQADSYSREVFEDLWRRHEEPDSRNRWDQPLFRLDPADRDSMAPALQGAVASLTEDTVSSPGLVVAKQLKPTMATSNNPLSATNLLHELDSAAQEVISSVSAAQELACSGAAGRVDMGADVDALHLTRPVTLADLRRHKRVFLKMATQNPNARLTDRASAKRMFVNFLREHIQ